MGMLKIRENQKTIPSILFEQEILEGIARFLGIQKDILNIETPIVIQLSPLNIGG